MIDNIQRTKTILTTTIFTTVTNIVLSIAKLVIGYISGSIGIVADGINNASDTVSALCSLIGFSIAKKFPTSTHPLGYGRIEYIASLIVSLLIIVASIECFKSSLDRILTPTTISFNPLMFVILIFSIAAKVVILIVNTKAGKKTNYEALILTGKDAKADIMSSSLTIVAIIVGRFTSFPVDGIMGIVIALLIAKSGLEALIETTSSIVGERPDKETVKKIRSILASHSPLSGGYDIILHSYGPERTFGTCNIEVPEDCKAEEIFDAMTEANKETQNCLGINFTFGLFAVNDSLPLVQKMKEEVLDELKAKCPQVISIHAFHIHFDSKRIHFDVVVDFSVHNYPAIKSQLEKILTSRWPEYEFAFTVDPDYA
ncbi:MAG: cation transporter [Spirochaetales bacterium]|nr:cation transporter [Spirochaetales bacterium]